MSCRETQWARFRRSSSTVERTVNPCVHIFRNHGGAQRHWTAMSRNQTLSPLPVPAHTTRINDADEQIRQAAPPVQRSGVCTDRVTGAKHVQQFRRTYFTAEWTDSVLVEVRVWGPRVLQDGSLGERELDYRSKNARATRGRSIAADRRGAAQHRPGRHP